MKLLYCFFISSLLNIHFCQAQIPFKIKAGGARSNLVLFNENTALLKTKPVLTWYGGIATTLRISTPLFFQPELLYSERGCNFHSEDNSVLIRRYGYISMPLLLGLHLSKKMSLLTGAEPGYMIWQRAKDIGYTRTYEDVDHHFNVDIDLGLAYQPLPRWTVEARILAGLIPLYQEWGGPRLSQYKTGKYDGNHINVQFGLNYNLKAK